jgi:endogenous inhibitor of DNA gyrase (YacG/DUF329 family)
MKRRVKESDLEAARRPDEIFEDRGFRWRVTASGYRWEDMRVVPWDDSDGEIKPTRVLTDGIAVGQPYERIEYSPLTVGDLFLDFAATPATEDGILAFANKRGLLGESVSVVWPKGPVGKDLHLGFAETREFWMRSIPDMHRAVNLWRMVNTLDTAGLAQLLKWVEKGGRARWGYWEDHPGVGFFSQAVLPAKGIPNEPGDIVTPARLLVQRWINERLSKHTSPLLLWNTDTGTQVIRIAPKNLLGAMWLQFARAVAGEASYRPCKACGKWITISTENHGYRKNREFCSAACRQKDHRARVKEARQLRAEGRTAREIAKHFDTTTRTIKNWLTKEK